jgi:hypothetical protein
MSAVAAVPPATWNMANANGARAPDHGLKTDAISSPNLSDSGAVNNLNN